MTVHITEAELARYVRAIIEKVQHGNEVIIERDDHRAVAVIRSPNRSGWPISDCIASAEASGSKVTLDEGFGTDVEEGIKSWQRPWNPPD